MTFQNFQRVKGHLKNTKNFVNGNSRNRTFSVLVAYQNRDRRTSNTRKKVCIKVFLNKKVGVYDCLTGASRVQLFPIKIESKKIPFELPSGCETRPEIQNISVMTINFSSLIGWDSFSESKWNPGLKPPNWAKIYSGSFTCSKETVRVQLVQCNEIAQKKTDRAG